MAPQFRTTQLINQLLSGGGGGPAISISGRVRLPLSLTVSVTAGVLGVALVSVSLGGVPLLTNVSSAASISLPGILLGASLTLAAGLYVLSTYTLSIG